MHRCPLSLAVVLLASCALGPSARLTVQLPPLPDAWSAAFPRMGCLLVFTDCAGTVQQVHLSGWESSAVIDCAKNGNTPVLAWPLLPSAADSGQPGALRPAGGIVPDSVQPGQDQAVLVLTWADGALGWVTSQLLAAGLDASLFNVTRLAAEMRKRQDPWDIDLDALATSIVSGTFSVYDINSLPCRNVRLAVGPGSWVTESPLKPAAVADAQGVLELADVSLGLHELFSAGGRVVKVDVRADEVISAPAAAHATGQAAAPGAAPPRVTFPAGPALTRRR